MVLHEAHHTLLRSSLNEFAVVLQKLDGRLRNKHVHPSLDRIQCDGVVGACIRQ